MRAVVMREFGPPEVLVPGDAPEPAAAGNQVVVQVTFAGITFVETQVRAGRSPFPEDPAKNTIVVIDNQQLTAPKPLSDRSWTAQFEKDTPCPVSSVSQM